MNRAEWKELSRRLRGKRGDAVRSELVMHGGTYFTVSFVPRGTDKGMHCNPSIIRDRSTESRLADSLDWTRCYRADMVRHRRNGSYFATHARNAFLAAVACIGDCRAIRTAASVFRTL